MTSNVSNWGRWGDEDERGLANVITGSTLLEALSIPRTGRMFCLGQRIVESGEPMVPDGGRPLHLMAVDGADFAAGRPTEHGAKRATDYLLLRVHGQTTHIDALGHVWNGDQIYNGFDANTIRSDGMRHCAIDQVGGIVTRGVLLDVPGLHGTTHVDGGYEVTPDDLVGAEQLADTTVGAGDAVVVRTGWYAVFSEDPDTYHGPRPGIGLEAARWLAERDVVLIGTDTSGVEVRPYPPETFAPVHQFLLRDVGMYLLEYLVLEELAAAGVGEFLFVLAPLRIVGGTGSPVNPLAIV